MITIGQSSTDLNLARKEDISTGLQSLLGLDCMKKETLSAIIRDKLRKPATRL
jgi:hypothetical protein